MKDNTKEKDKLVISHAEINAIKKASKKEDAWRLVDCTLYCTLEPSISIISSSDLSL